MNEIGLEINEYKYFMCIHGSTKIFTFTKLIRKTNSMDLNVTTMGQSIFK